MVAVTCIFMERVTYIYGSGVVGTIQKTPLFAKNSIYCKVGLNCSSKQEKLRETGQFERFLASSVLSDPPNFTKLREAGPSSFTQLSEPPDFAQPRETGLFGKLGEVGWFGKC